MSDLPPFPPSDHFVSGIRESCRNLRVSSGVAVKRSSIEALLNSPSFLRSFKRVSKSHGLSFPLSYPSVASEVNLLSILSLLNFGSGYRVPLHEHTGSGAWDNIRGLVLSMYITSSVDTDIMSAKGIATIREDQVADLMKVRLHQERPHESIPGVVVGELKGHIYDLVKLITRTLNETGEILVKLGYPDLGTYVLKVLQEAETAGKTKGQGPCADVFLRVLTGAIPAFQDMAIVNDHPVYVFKKALFLIQALAIRFGSSKTIPVPDTSSLPVYSDNVLPSLLIHLGVIDVSHASVGLADTFKIEEADVAKLLTVAEGEPEPSHVIARMPKSVPSEGPVLTTEQAYILRAAAIDACEMIVEDARSHPVTEDNEWVHNITLPDLDMWLWAVAKDRVDYRNLERFVLRDTVMF